MLLRNTLDECLSTGRAHHKGSLKAAFDQSLHCGALVKHETNIKAFSTQLALEPDALPMLLISQLFVYVNFRFALEGRQESIDDLVLQQQSTVIIFGGSHVGDTCCFRALTYFQFFVFVMELVGVIATSRLREEAVSYLNDAKLHTETSSKTNMLKRLKEILLHRDSALLHEFIPHLMELQTERSAPVRNYLVQYAKSSVSLFQLEALHSCFSFGFVMHPNSNVRKCFYSKVSYI
ncbi:hypothetical protein L7F22_043472 [Adiantum nelumboides]|nr:hypothetical protein [Adiantum nelumboides]